MVIEHLNASEIRPGDVIIDPVKPGESSGEVWQVRMVYALPNNSNTIKLFLNSVADGSPITRVVGKTFQVAVDFTIYDPEKSMDELKGLLDAL